jgi:hypothetical protein
MRMHRALLKPEAEAEEECSSSFACASGFNAAMNNPG